MEDPLYDEYIRAISSFVAGEMTALEFETQYLSLYKSDALVRADEAESILFDLFSDVDAFVADPELRGPQDLDEHQLRERARVALEGL